MSVFAGWLIKCAKWYIEFQKFNLNDVHKMLSRYFPFFFLATVLAVADQSDLSRLQSAYLPKREVGQPEFLKAHPEWDGRGVVIAIFDTGVDPAAAGLAVTSTGERKVLDILDASGSGDVDTSHSVKQGEDGTLPGLSGRNLTLPAGIVNPGGEYRLGLKRAADLFPRSVLRRLKEHEAGIWKGELSQIRAARNLEQRDTDRSFLEKAPEDQTRAEQDQAARESLLEALEDGYAGNQPEIHFDCVLWNDGEFWRVLVDTDRDGDLADEVMLRPYGVAGEYGVFDSVSNLSFGVQVYEGGDLLSIVTVNDTHGTHVAAIAAAHDPDNPDRNGIAPGAQIVSIRIGDPRTGGSYGDSERRAVALAAQAGVDIVNASWGGSSVYQDGRDANSMTYDMLVERYGIFTVVSAGNDGPALSTLGSAGGEAGRVLGVGAYVSPEMGEVLYSTLEQNGEATLQFSSRGPTKDGDLGVDVTAPGAALASYSGESLTGFEMTHGTSMSSPSAAGVAALLVSAAKQEGLATDPARLRAAMMLGARWIESEAVYSKGTGLINVSNSWDKLKAIQNEQAFGAFYDLEVSQGSFNPQGRGLYLREPDPKERLRVVVRVSPAWIEAVSAEEQFAFDTSFRLRSTADWIEVPEFFHMANAENHFIAHVTVPDGVDSFGSLYTAEIEAVITGKEELGPVFRVPVTIVRGKPVPDDLDDPVKATLDMEPAKTERLFLNVPEGASWLNVKVKHVAEDPIARQFILHGMTLAQEVPVYASGDPNYMRLDEGEERVLNLPTYGGQVMELTVYQYWSSVGSCQLEMELEWGGLGLEQSPTVFTENQGWAAVPVKSLRDQDVRGGKQKLDQAIYVHMPVRVDRIPFDERAALPPSPKTPAVTRQEMVRQVFELSFEEPFKADLEYPQIYDISEFFGGGLTEVFHESGNTSLSAQALVKTVSLFQRERASSSAVTTRSRVRSLGSPKASP
jgi:tripeptidyl-peptidase-2